MKINKLIIDSSNSVTDLCKLGVKHPTDKSAFATNGLHRHGYMAIYDMLFMQLRYKKIRLAEGGILNNMSMKCWREYFPYAELYGFEYDLSLLQQAIDDKLQNTYYYEMNVKETSSIIDTFEKTGGNFDIIIDDMIHDVHHNALFAKQAYKYLKKGGLLIIEDICEVYNTKYGNNHENLYEEYLSELEPYFSSMTFISSQHENKFSADLNNDKLLVFCRNDKDL